MYVINLFLAFNNNHHLFGDLYITMVLHPITKSATNEIKLYQNKIINARKKKFQLMVAPKKIHIVTNKTVFSISTNQIRSP